MLSSIIEPNMIGKLIGLVRQSLDGNSRDYTKGSIRQAVILLAIPMVIEMIGEGIFSLVDAFFVSRISTAAVTTVGITETVSTIIYSIAIGISIAITAMVARRIGEKDHHKAAQSAAQSIILSIGVSIILTIFSLLFSADVLQFMSQDSEVVGIGAIYTTIVFSSNLSIILLFVLNGVFRGAGDANMAMRSLWIANLANIILDPLLIFGVWIFPEYGLMGAAIATTIGRSLGVVYQFYHLFVPNQHTSLILKKSDFSFDLLIMKRLSNVASTGSLQFAIGSSSWIFIAYLLAGFGQEIFAGYTFAVRIVIFAILPAFGVANAAATLVGQNLGALQSHRAELSVWLSAKYNAIFMGILGIIFFAFAKEIIGIFTTDPTVLKAGVLSLQIFSVANAFFAYGMVVNQAFGGAGDTRTPTYINLIAFWLIEIPLAFAVVHLWGGGLREVLFAIIVSESILTLMAVYWFRKGQWKKSII